MTLPNPMLRHPATGLLPRGLFLMTSAHEARRAGVLVESVQCCGDRPPLLCVTMKRGHWIEPIIRDAHTFAVCILDPNDKLVLRKFVEPGMPREGGDPFDCMPIERLATGAPILSRAVAALDCQVVRHLEVDNDHALYIGTVVASRVFQPIAQPLTQPGSQNNPQKNARSATSMTA